MSAAAVMTQPTGLAAVRDVRFTNAQNQFGEVIMVNEALLTTMKHTTKLVIDAPVIQLAGDLNVDDVTAANVTATVKLTAPILAGTEQATTDGLGVEAGPISIDATTVNLTGDVAAVGDVSAAKVVAPIVEAETAVASTSLTTPEIIGVDMEGTTFLNVTAQFTDVSGHLIAQQDIESATQVIAPTVQALTFTVADPLTDDMNVTARNIILNGNVEIKGTLDTINTQVLTVKDKEIKLGFIDADGDGVDDQTTDTLRDGGGIIMPGEPENLPAGKDGALYEHSLRWKRKDGDFAVGGAELAPHQKPLWTFSGGGIAVDAPYGNNLMGSWFMAPYFDAVTSVPSFGLYYKSAGADPVLVQDFRAPSLA
jgi:hypothetical protein